jgi:AraC family transcriptional regulator of adaptative response/methylated-DNA-[protein]-cysteine methyltransferase
MGTVRTMNASLARLTAPIVPPTAVPDRRLPRDPWTTVRARTVDPGAEFVFGVVSTRIYCRPDCPARRPLKRNVIFFANPRAASESGFRPCKRCRPEAPNPDSSALLAVRRVWRHIVSHPDARLTLAELARVGETSPTQLRRSFRRYLGVSPRTYVDSARLDRVRRSLREGVSVRRAVYGAGFRSLGALYVPGRPPRLGFIASSLRRGGDGSSIEYTCLGSPFGRVLVAATRWGVCAVYLGDSDAGLIDRLCREFPRAQIGEGSGPDVASWAARVRSFVDGRGTGLGTLPLDIRATAFEHSVFAALREIPVGVVRTYSDIARRLGRPQAARAVAGACGRNPVALAIPCHRVVRADGSPGGYRWGPERKRAILAAEREAAVREPAPARDEASASG